MNASRVCCRGRLALCWLAIPWITGCGGKPAAAPANVRPVRTMIVAAGEEAHVRSFPGRVEAQKSAELAFQVPGLLTNFPVK